MRHSCPNIEGLHHLVLLTLALENTACASAVAFFICEELDGRY